MASTQLYAHPLKRIRQGPAEALFGFALADRLTAPTARPLTDQDRAQKVYQRLQAQLHMVARFWHSGIPAWDLRFVKTTHSPHVSIGLLCRVPCPEYASMEQYSRHCLGPAQYVQSLFKEFGYDLIPLTDWPSCKLFLEPFEYRSLAEIRRCEHLSEICYAHESLEFYVTYPWKWSGSTNHGLFDTLTRLQGDCLVSACLLPTRLNPDEQGILQHVTSGAVRNELLQAGPVGYEALRIYEGFLRDLQQPSLLRITLAASSAAVLERIGLAFLEDLEPSRHAQSGPVLQYPRTPYELQALQQGLSYLEWVPWGNLRDTVHQTARLRYLVDSKEGSMAFRLPVTDNSAQTIKVLLVFANPTNTERLELAREERAVKEAIAFSRYRDNIELHVCPASTIHDLRRALMKHGFQIVHIAAHGSKEGLALENPLGKAHVISPHGMAELLKLHRETHNMLRCVLLNSCDSLLQGQLISAGVPFVIAMEGSLGDKAAIEFATGFYDAIGEGMDIENAYKQGRVAVQVATSNAQFMSHLFPQNP